MEPVLPFNSCLHQTFLHWLLPRDWKDSILEMFKALFTNLRGRERERTQGYPTGWFTSQRLVAGNLDHKPDVPLRWQEPKLWNHGYCLPGHTSAGGWRQEWGQASTPSTLVQTTGFPHGIPSDLGCTSTLQRCLRRVCGKLSRPQLSPCPLLEPWPSVRKGCYVGKTTSTQMNSNKVHSFMVFLCKRFWPSSIWKHTNAWFLEETTTVI